MAASTWWLIAGSVLLLAGLVIAFRGVFADRAKGRRRCPSCFYAMDGLAALQCPECGKAAKSERHLLRTRRHWRAVHLGLLLIAMGGGVAARPFLVAKNAWTAVPHSVLQHVVAHSSVLPARQRQKAQDAFIKSRLTQAEYGRVMTCYASMLRNPSEWQQADMVQYLIGSPRLNADGTLAIAAWPQFVWDVTHESWNAYGLLSDLAAVEVADGLAFQWRWRKDIRGQLNGRDVMVIAFWKPAAAGWATERLFAAGPEEWTVYAIDPRSDKGRVFKTLLQELRGESVVNRRRAAFALQKFYFNVNTHWLEVPEDMKWMREQYPALTELDPLVREAGDELARIVTGEVPGDAVFAAGVLADEGHLWKATIERLLEAPDKLPVGVEKELKEAITPVDPSRSP